MAESRELFQQKVPSQMFNQVLNTPGEIIFKVIILKVLSSTAKTSRKTMLFNQTPKLNISRAMFVFQQTNLNDTGAAHIKSLASHVAFVQLQPVAIISRRTVMITYFRRKINQELVMIVIYQQGPKIVTKTEIKEPLLLKSNLIKNLKSSRFIIISGSVGNLKALQDLKSKFQNLVICFRVDFVFFEFTL